MKLVMRVPTFQFIVLQGIVGSLPWTAIVFFTLWFELIGELLHEIIHDIHIYIGWMFLDE